MKEAVNCQKLLEQGFAKVLVIAFAEALAEEREEGYAAAYLENFAQGFLQGRVEGRVEEAQHILLLLGTELFGRPSVQVRRVLDRVTDIDVLEALLLRVIEVRTWNELLDELQ